MAARTRTGTARRSCTKRCRRRRRRSSSARPRTSSPTSSCSSRPRSTRRQSTPVGFEVSFGRPLDDDEEPLARAEPVEIALARPHVPDRRPHRSHRRGRRRLVRGARLQDRRVLAGQLEGRVRRRPSSAARALWARCGRTAQGPLQEAEGHRRACTTSPATRDARSASGSLLPRRRRSRPCWATARRDRHGAVHPTRRRGQLQVLRLRRGVRRRRRTCRPDAKLADARFQAYREARGP